MKPSVIVSGLLLDGIGLAQAARGYARALDTRDYFVRQHVQRLPYRPDPVGDPGPSGRLMIEQAVDETEVDVVVTCLNPPELRDLRISRQRHPAGRVNVGMWAWEVDPAPAEWAEEGTRFDELWVNTEYIAGLVRPLVSCPVVAIPPAVTVSPSNGVTCDLLDDRPTFLVLADGASSLIRKNPLGAIEAFKRAFEPGSGPRMLVKIWNGASDSGEAAKLRAAAADRPDVDIVDSWLARDEFAALVSGSACLVSLHRAEGFGLPIFEALAVGVPVVATGWSGPMDLLDDRHAFFVRSETVPIPRGAPPYPVGGVWAEPDLDHAAELMRAVWSDPTAARERAEVGRRLVAAELSERAIGARLAERVDVLLAQVGARTPKSVLRPAVSVVSHAGAPWPMIAPFLRAAMAQVDEQGGELILGVSGPDVVPERFRPPRVRIVDVGSTSPFEQRAAALAACDADLVVVTEDHCIPAPGWLVAYDSTYSQGRSLLLAGPIGNGSTGSSVDWANYFMGFVAYAPPILEVPDGRCPTVANCAFDGAHLRDELGSAPRAGALEREFIPDLWRKGETEIVPAAIVDHTQGFPGWHHVRNHFDDARTAGAHEHRLDPTYRPSLMPGALRQEAQQVLRGLVPAVQDHDELLDPFHRARYWLRALAGARVVGLAVGARWGEGHSPDRLD